MSYKTMLVHLDTGSSRRQRLDLALALAERHGAYLVGLFALPALNVPIAPEVAPVWLDAMLDERRAASEEAALEFHDKVKRYGARSEWHATLTDGYAALVHHARHADLVIAGQPDPDSGLPETFSHGLVMSAGRPVLYVPYAGRFESCGRRVLVAWNASREAARAVADAVPFLQQAEAAEVVTFTDKAPLDPGMEAYLARHGARASVTALSAGILDTGSAILARAADNAADLIVMGAYSHSRLRELVLGGATRELFLSMTVPTLMSH